MGIHKPSRHPIGKLRATDRHGDWHPAEVIAAIWIRKSSITRLSRKHGYATDGLKLALRQPWPKAEKIIADFLGVKPQEIWPSRYDEKGRPNRRKGRPAADGITGSARAVIHGRRAA